MTTQAKIKPYPIINTGFRVVEQIIPFLSPLLAFILLIYLYDHGKNTLSLRENRADLALYTFALMWIGLASSWNLIGGYTGYIDFGHTVFVGIGSYTVANLMWSAVYEDLTLDYNFTFWQSLPVVFIVGAIFAGLVGWPTLRLKGPYFAIAMLGTFVAVREMSNTLPDLTRGGRGITFRRPFAEPLDVYYTMLGLTAGIFFISLWIYRSQLGKMLQAIREDEVGADMRGINTTSIKIGIFMLAGGFTAMFGATRAWWQTQVEPSIVFPEDYTIKIIMMVMLGGIGRPWGPVLGAALFYYGETTIWAELGSLNLIMTGTVLLVLVLFVPSGVLGLLDPEDRGLPWHLRRIRNYLLPKDSKASQVVSAETIQLTVSRASTHFEAIASRIAYPLFVILIAGVLILKWNDFVLETRLMIGAMIFYFIYLAYLSIYDKAQEVDPKDFEGKVLLEGQNVVKDFGGLRAVNEVNFKVVGGEIVGLLGPNGSGKTTLFNCISGVLQVNAGNIYLDGKRINKSAPWRINRLGLSRTFQKIRVYKNLTVFDNMLLARRWSVVPPFLWLWIAPPYIRHQADELLDFLLLTQVRHNLARNLSGGQQRLLEIGMSLMSNPLIVLLDEATSGVNPALIEEIKMVIRRLNQELGVTFFLIEHNMNFIMDLCARLYVLDYGSLIAEGQPHEIQSNPTVIEAYFGRDE